MPFTDGVGSPEPTSASDAPPSYGNPDLAAVAATVSVVGILMALLVFWLVLRLRHAQPAPPIPIAVRPVSAARPSFAPSEASSKFGFLRKPLRLSHRQKGASWDFADPDPFSCPKESLFDPSKHRPAPLALVPSHSRRSSTHKDEFGPCSPSTPASVDFIEPPPPAYCPDSHPFHPKGTSPC